MICHPLDGKLFVFIGGRGGSREGDMANFLTVLRVALAPVFVVLMVQSNHHPLLRYLAMLVFGLGALTDMADGYVARRTETVSRFGITADPLADRIFIGTALITLYAMRILPLAFLVIVLGRDLIMAAGYPLMGKIDREKVAVHWTGKLATAILFLAITMLILSPAPHQGSRVSFEGFQFASAGSWQTWGLWLFVLGIAWSLVSAGVYASRVLEMVKERRSEP